MIKAGGGGNSNLGMTGTCRPTLRSVFKDFRSIFVSTSIDFWQAKPVEFPRNQVSFQMHNMTVKLQPTTFQS